MKRPLVANTAYSQTFKPMNLDLKEYRMDDR